jgi:hypothetical protein
MPKEYRMFYGARLKIERAEKHINDLRKRAIAFAPDAYTLSVQFNGETGEEFIEIEVADNLPGDFPLIIGDTLHNLTGALDFSVNDVVISRVRKWDSHTRFPFRDARDKVETAINGALIKQASPAVANFIIHDVKPYKGGNDALWALHNLNILDKHRLLLPLMQVSAVNGIRAEDENGKVVFDGTWVITGKRKAIHDCTGYRNVKITNNGKAVLLIFFDHGLPMQGESIIPALHQLLEVVYGVVDGIERTFLAEI